MTTQGSTRSIDLDHLETYIHTTMTQWDIPGLSLSIVKDGQIIVAKGYGTREVGKNLPVDQYTLFPITGGSRLFTASALALLVAEGRLCWEDRLVDLLPGFKTGSELINQEATLIDAMAMRIGLPGELLASFPNPGLSRQELLNKLQFLNRPVSFRDGLGSSFLMSVAAGEVIAAVTGISWDKFVWERLIKPLGMSTTITGPQWLPTRDNIAAPHDKSGDQRVPSFHAATDNLGPAYSVYSNAADMAQWLKLHLDKGVVHQQTEDNSTVAEGSVLIPEAQVDLMQKVHMGASAGLPGYVADLAGCGLGILILTHRSGCRVYGYGGDTQGFEAFNVFVPELQLGIAVMVNAHTAIPQRLIPWILDRFTGLPEKDWINDTLGELEQRYVTSPTEKLNQLRQELTLSSQLPCLPLSAYEGVYQHSFLGDLTIYQSGNTLAYTFGETWEGELPHCNHNTFFREPVKPFYNRCFFRGPLRFNLDYAGTVESLTIEEGEFHKCKV